jgi:phosphatidylglycerol:prolipoprotein diacylglycerol transferase
MPFPDINEVIFQIGPFAIRWYSMAYLFGILFGWRYLIALANRPQLWTNKSPYTKLDVDDFLPFVTFGIIIGGRLGYVLFYNPSYYIANPQEIYAVWKGGMSFHGGLLGALLAGFLFVRRRNIAAWSWLDVMAASAPVGLFLGRIANFINAELWGRPTDLPWGIIFPTAGPLPRHPSQLYEATLEGLVLFIVLSYMIFARNALRRPGLVTGIFALGYGVARFIVEYAREPDGHLGTLAFGLTMGQSLSLPLILAGIFVIWRSRKPATA